eukprot:TRINITY_DN60081_c1_g1_i1.p1 TRINITY_DN60081_c1_g1~~TRINITY_DN60081_c1_g1_i1.p1  ORF type:complete len:209 (-),score=16.47 TRINITY_DN60081_c1_g1_i1:6-545(-)
MYKKKTGQGHKSKRQVQKEIQLVKIARQHKNVTILKEKGETLLSIDITTGKDKAAREIVPKAHPHAFLTICRANLPGPNNLAGALQKRACTYEILNAFHRDAGWTAAGGLAANPEFTHNQPGPFHACFGTMSRVLDFVDHINGRFVAADLGVMAAHTLVLEVIYQVGTNFWITMKLHSH